jgi:hypothetical protein
VKFNLAILVPVLIILAGCSKNNKADKWVYFSTTKSNKLYYTRDKMSKSDEGLVKIWVKSVFNEVRHVEDKDISYTKNMYMIKCSEKRYKVNIGFNYTKDDEAASKTVAEQDNSAIPLIMDRSNKELVFNSSTTVQDAYLPIVSDSPADHLHSIVCK